MVLLIAMPAGSGSRSIVSVAHPAPTSHARTREKSANCAACVGHVLCTAKLVAVTKPILHCYLSPDVTIIC